MPPRKRRSYRDRRRTDRALLWVDHSQHSLPAAGLPWLLQSYVWQGYDLCPAFPALNKFLNFWLETLEGPLHSVTVARARLIRPAEIRAIDAVLADGVGRARNLARQTMDAVKDVVGFVAVLIGAPRVPQPNLRRSPALELASKFAT